MISAVSAHAPDPALPVPTFEQSAALIRSRRTNLRMDRERPVDRALVAQLCELATWAPNHRMTQPWRFGVVSGDVRAQLGNYVAAHLIAHGATDEAKLDKARSKFLRAPTILLVGSASAADAPAEVRVEDRDAASAGIQNVLLGATAAGLCSYWGSGAVCDVDAVKALCGLAPKDQLLGAIYLGWPIGDVPVPARSAPIITWTYE
jgi:nitroreductase